MNEGVGEKTPHLAAIPDFRAIKLQKRDHGTGSESNQHRRQNRDRDMQYDQHRRHVDGIAAHPRNRPIIIGGRYSEHESNKQPAF